MSSRTRRIVALAQNQDNHYLRDLNRDKRDCTVSSSDSSVLEISENLRDVIEGIQVDSPRGNFTFIKYPKYSTQHYFFIILDDFELEKIYSSNTDDDPTYYPSDSDENFPRQINSLEDCDDQYSPSVSREQLLQISNTVSVSHTHK